MNLKFTTLCCLFFASSFLSAAIICPPDKYLTCHDDINYLPLVGTPTVFGGSSGQLRYFDQSPNSICNVGHVIRTWYLDYNGNQSFDTGEHACIQNIYVSYTPGTTTIDWPTDKVLNCKENIPNENPTWVSGPCDVVGVSKTDQVFETDTKSCYEILRHFTVVNWCIHVPGTSVGIWYHTQVIKIEDPSRPVIKNCDQVILGTDFECSATFKLSNSAIDISPCGQQKLLWSAEVDLWNDGSIEYTYSHDHTNPLFRLNIVGSGESVSFTLPYKVIRGYHKVTWSVHDQCGNAAKCDQKVHVKDTKKPTPYLHEILSSAFEGNIGPLKIPAMIFDIGSFDNCTKPSWLRFSFSSNVNDTIRTVTCDNAGFQFYTIYVTDLEGNQESVDVFMLVFDNGSCGNRLKLAGKINKSDGAPLSDITFRLTSPSWPLQSQMATSDTKGLFVWENISLYKDMEISTHYTEQLKEALDVADLKLLQDYIMGNEKLKNFQYIAADMDTDKKIRVKDLELLKKRILVPDFTFDKYWSFACDIDSLKDVNELLTIKDKLVLSASDGRIDFKAIYLGDITGANSRKTSNRTETMISSNVSLGKIEYSVKEAKFLEGLQLSIAIPQEMKFIKVESPYFDLQDNAIRISDDNVLRFVVTKEMSISEGILFTLVFDTEIVNSMAPIIMSGSKLLLPGYETTEIREERQWETVPGIFVYPNPTYNGFIVVGDDIDVLSIKNASGQSMYFNKNGHQVDFEAIAGVYYVSIKSGDTLITKKIIRL